MKNKPDVEPLWPAAETDPRFPLGPWVGFWIQGGFGKQKMRLAMSFAAGRVSGTVTDIVGRFVFDGIYDLKSGRCQMTKQYLGAHRLTYDGVSQGNGLWLWGVWRQVFGRGGFHIWPEGEEDPTQKRVKAANELPNLRTRRLESAEILSP
jgi:hypothetical protein